MDTAVDYELALDEEKLGWSQLLRDDMEPVNKELVVRILLVGNLLIRTRLTRS